VSARNRSNLSIKDECRPDSEAVKCGFRNANCGMNFRLGNGTRAKPDSAKPTSRHACWEGQHRLITRARRSPRRRQIRPSPIRVNLRGLGLYAEDLSRRDSAKVAQYPAAAGLGNDAKRHVRPGSGRDDRNVRLLVSHAAQRLPALVDRPVRVRDGYLFKNAYPALRTGLLSPGPCGTDFL
jgi:hypothetical protein